MTQTRKQRRRWAATMLIALAIVAGLAWWIQRQGSSNAAPQPAASAAAAGGSAGNTNDDRRRLSRGVAGGAAAADTANRDAALPALDAPFDGIYADLKRRADAGEPKAACRLAAELDQCDRRRQELAQLDAGIRQIGVQPAPVNAPPDVRQRMLEARKRALSDLAQQSERALRGLEQCDRVPAMTPAQRTGYWRVAALGGHLSSLTQYAVGNGFRWRDILQNLPALQTYRGEAEALARRAAAAGDLKATLALAHAYSSANQENRSRAFLLQVIEPDDVEALALYQRVAGQIADDQRTIARPMRDGLARTIQALQQVMSKEQLSQANDAMRRYDREWAAPDPRDVLPEATARGGLVQDVDRAACAENRFVAP